MKKLLWAACALVLLGALGLLPFRAVEISDLLPVKTVVVTRSGEEYIIDVGAGVRAAGKTLSQALAALREEVTGTVFFPTAEQVILTEPAEDGIEAVVTEPSFRPAAGIYRTPDPAPDPEALGAYLATHPSNVTVMTVRAALALGETPDLPRIFRTQGGYRVAA